MSLFSDTVTAGGTDFGASDGKHVEGCGCSGCAGPGEAAGDGLTGVLSGPKPIWSLDQIVQNALRNNAAWPQNAVIEYSFRDALPSGYDPKVTFVAFTDVERQMTRMAFELIADVINIKFIEVTDDGLTPKSTDRIYFGADSALPDVEWGHAQTWSYSTSPRRRLAGSEIWLNPDNVAERAWVIGGYNFHALMHEMLHALGIPHPGDYNAGDDANGDGKPDPITYSADASFAQDSRQFTIMSYFGAANTGSDHVTEGPSGGGWSGATPLLHDVAALQALYGANTATRAGDTVYGYNATAGRSVYDFAAWFQPTLTPAGQTILPAPIFTVWDGGGVDTLDFSATDLAVNVDLNAGAFSDAFGMTNNISIAWGVVMENAIGGGVADVLRGNTVGNSLEGRGGGDVLYGFGGADRLLGDDGGDQLVGGAGDDYLVGGSGDDVFVFARADGADVVADFSPGEGSDDRIDLRAFVELSETSAVLARTTQVGADIRIDLGDGSVTLRNVSRSLLSADDFLLAAAGAPRPLASDFSGDGEADLMWRQTGGELHLWRSSSGETFESQNLGYVDQAWSVQELADFTGDGKTDVLWRDKGGTVHLWRSDGDGGFSGVQDLGFVDFAWSIVDGADFTGDGRADILWRGPMGQLHVWRSSADGFAGVQDLGTIGLDWITQESRDFNGDGKADLLWRHSSGELHLWNSGPDGFTSYELGNIPTSWTVQETADFNADGKADLLWRNEGGQVHLWQSTPAGFTSMDLGFVSEDWTVEEADDFNGDARADIVWRHEGGATHLWLTNSDKGYTSVEIGQVPLEWMLVV